MAHKPTKSRPSSPFDHQWSMMPWVFGRVAKYNKFNIVTFGNKKRRMKILTAVEFLSSKRKDIRLHPAPRLRSWSYPESGVEPACWWSAEKFHSMSWHPLLAPRSPFQVGHLVRLQSICFGIGETSNIPWTIGPRIVHEACPSNATEKVDYLVYPYTTVWG